MIRGHNVFAGYLDNPEATARRWWTAGSAPATSAPRTPTGFLSIVDRKKDLIIRGGFNVYPREVEEVLAGHPASPRSRSSASPDEVYGEEICAVVVRSPDGCRPDEAT